MHTLEYSPDINGQERVMKQSSLKAVSNQHLFGVSPFLVVGWLVIAFENNTILQETC